MTQSYFRAALTAGIALISLAAACKPAHAQVAVFDASNFTENVMTAARELDQVNNEIQSLENQATMLINQAKNLASLPYSTLAQLDQSINQTQQLLAQAQNIAYDVTTIDQAFTQVYPESYSSSASSQQLENDAQTRWENARAGYQDAMNVQAGAVQNLAAVHSQVDTLVSSSQSAEGALQASQAGNQILSVVSGQLADVTALIAAQGRAAALAGAADTESQEQAQTELNQFLSIGNGYQPQPVEMFHQQ
ncbi:P-type conjugative transfer protein TrbJ [Acidocella facilis]|uniref:P-type conjugative transfer protein TrbJ n=1 Tax=Acidocella facilis TaxID=525 RepID=UPI001F2417A0|nr:P-type conjugative transfer protein TrbJ [Acidocella facilis]